MRHPLRSLVGQGFWYTVANVAYKLGGIVLLPLYTNSAYLSVDAFGIWGVFEITVSLAVAIIGLQLAAGLIRFYPDAGDLKQLVSTTWWTTFAMGIASAVFAAGLVGLLVPEDMQVLYLLLIVYILAELLLAIPFALLRAQGKAAAYMLLSVVKLILIIGLNLLWLGHYGLGLFGLVQAFGVASIVTLVLGLVTTGPGFYLNLSFRPGLARDLLRFSAPLVISGLGSMVLNAGDRYVLALFHPAEEIALYTLAAKIGGVVNMFAIQPLQLAFFPILFRLAAGQHSEVLRLLARYLAFGFCLLVIGLTLFSDPVLDIMRADEIYDRAVRLVPWIAFGFSLFGFSILFDGVLTFHHRTGTTSMWMAISAVANIVLNLIFVPMFGALAAAITTFLSYGLLFVGRLFASQKTMVVHYPWTAVAGMGIATGVTAFAGLRVPFPDGPTGWLLRAGVLLGWGIFIFAGRWITLDDFREVLKVFRQKETKPSNK